ncbi:MAG: hypothetical protein AAFN93_19595 [Bacteroidota bacterium]
MKLIIDEPYFSDGLKWTAAIIGVGLSIYFLISTTYFILIFLILITVLILFSTRYLIEINTSEKLINDQFHFLWIPVKSEKINYDHLDMISIDKERTTYTANSRGKTGVTDYNEYIATLHFNTSQKIELKRSIDYQEFAERINDISNQLELPVERSF